MVDNMSKRGFDPLRYQFEALSERLDRLERDARQQRVAGRRKPRR